MSYQFNLGLIQDQHLTHLYLLADHAKKAFERPEASRFFQSITDLLVKENMRRRNDREASQHTIEWTFDASDMHPVTMIFLGDFFREKSRQFEEEAPPVSTFFERFKNILSDTIDREVPLSLQRTIRKKQVELQREETAER